MDETAKYNRDRWRALASVNALYTRPKLDLDEATSRVLLDPDGTLGDLRGKRVLCLAAGGGRQSAAFGLLGAEVTLVDLSEEQLERDRQMARHYNLVMTLIQGDMRDLSMLPPQAFDIVYHPYSLNFVPDAEQVFRQVRRVIRQGGLYDLMCANPFAIGVQSSDWNGSGYTVSAYYVQGQRVQCEDEVWVYDRNTHGSIPPSVEYRQTLSKLVNGLVENGFVIFRVQETNAGGVSFDAEPGTWEHFTAVLPPWLIIRAHFRPDVLGAQAILKEEHHAGD
jgi:ubiquinone/menaquinone biosynthesis C-methylase UbiE